MCPWASYAATVATFIRCVCFSGQRYLQYGGSVPDPVVMVVKPTLMINCGLQLMPLSTVHHEIKRRRQTRLWRLTYNILRYSRASYELRWYRLPVRMPLGPRLLLSKNRSPMRALCYIFIPAAPLNLSKTIAKHY